jgi:response regulator NasT
VHDDLPSLLRVLLIDDGAGRVEALREGLAGLRCDVVGVLDSPLLIHDCVQQLQPDVVIVASDSPSRDTLENLAVLSARMPRPVVVFTDDPNRAVMQRAIAAGVSAYVVAGMQPQRLAAVLNVAIARFEQETALRNELAQARERLAARKRIERAKGILMREHGLDEEAAYAHLRRLAMSRKLRLVEIADRIIEAKSLLS